MSRTSMMPLPVPRLSLLVALLSLPVWTATARALSLSGIPPTSVAVGDEYRFLPVVEDADPDALQFYYINKPGWSKIYRGSGLIRGTPVAPGSYPGIQIGATDGVSYVSLPPFTITVTPSPALIEVGIADLTWIRPSYNTDGTPLTDLAGYRISYGTDAAALDHEIRVSSPAATTALIENLSPAIWYFEIAAVNAARVSSAFSATASDAIP